MRIDGSLRIWLRMVIQQRRCLLNESKSEWRVLLLLLVLLTITGGIEAGGGTSGVPHCWSQNDPCLVGLFKDSIFTLSYASFWGYLDSPGATQMHVALKAGVLSFFASIFSKTHQPENIIPLWLHFSHFTIKDSCTGQSMFFWILGVGLYWKWQTPYYAYFCCFNSLKHCYQ